MPYSDKVVIGEFDSPAPHMYETHPETHNLFNYTYTYPQQWVSKKNTTVTETQYDSDGKVVKVTVTETEELTPVYNPTYTVNK